MMSKTLMPVLADEYLQSSELINFYVSNILDKKKTADAIKLLSIHHPLGKFQHLKRVRRAGGKNCPLQILLCPEEAARHSHCSLAADTTLDVLSVNDTPATTLTESDLAENSVREQRMPVTVEPTGSSCEDPSSVGDSDAAGVTVSSLLQCNVEQDMFSKPYLVKVPRCAPLTRKQYEEAMIYWPITFHEDKRIAQLLSGKFFSETEVKKIQSYLQQAKAMADISQLKKQGSNGIVIVDPTEDSIIAKGHSLTNDNPLLHAAMVGVDLVAKSQGGGMWNITDKDMHILSHGFHNEEISVEKTGPYLCTGYHVYMSTEPCPMCSMALLHSRVSCVFYSQPHSDGALGSRYKLHTIPSLNHHFDVFCWTGDLFSDR